MKEETWISNPLSTNLKGGTNEKIYQSFHAISFWFSNQFLCTAK
jgi:hypothetical protein